MTGECPGTGHKVRTAGQTRARRGGMRADHRRRARLLHHPARGAQTGTFSAPEPTITLGAAAAPNGSARVLPDLPHHSAWCCWSTSSGAGLRT